MYPDVLAATGHYVQRPYLGSGDSAEDLASVTSLVGRCNPERARERSTSRDAPTRGPATRPYSERCHERPAVDHEVSDFDGGAVLVTRFVEGGQLPDGAENRDATFRASQTARPSRTPPVRHTRLRRHHLRTHAHNRPARRWRRNWQSKPPYERGQTAEVFAVGPTASQSVPDAEQAPETTNGMMRSSGHPQVHGRRSSRLPNEHDPFLRRPTGRLPLREPRATDGGKGERHRRED